MCKWLLILLVLFFSTPSHSTVADGLCFIESLNGEAKNYGHGFIADGALHSSARVLSQASRVYCLQGGVLEDITELLKGRVVYNKAYTTSNSFEQEVKAPFDYATIKLSKDLETDFVLDEFSSLSDKVKSDREKELAGKPWYRARIRINSNNLDDEFNFEIMSLFAESYVEELSGDLKGLKIGAESGVTELLSLVETAELSDRVAFLDESLPTRSSYLGAPLFQVLDSGELLVSGIASEVGSYMEGSSQTHQTLYTPAMNFKTNKKKAPQKEEPPLEEEELFCKAVL